MAIFAIIKWKNSSKFHTSQHIYRSLTPIDINSLPPTYYVLGPGERSFIDNDVSPLETYYYAISTVFRDIEKLSTVLELFNPYPPETLGLKINGQDGTVITHEDLDITWITNEDPLIEYVLSFTGEEGASLINKQVGAVGQDLFTKIEEKTIFNTAVSNPTGVFDKVEKIVENEELNDTYTMGMSPNMFFDFDDTYSFGAVSERVSQVKHFPVGGDFLFEEPRVAPNSLPGSFSCSPRGSYIDISSLHSFNFMAQKQFTFSWVFRIEDPSLAGTAVFMSSDGGYTLTVFKLYYSNGTFKLYTAARSRALSAESEPGLLTDGLPHTITCVSNTSTIRVYLDKTLIIDLSSLRVGGPLTNPPSYCSGPVEDPNNLKIFFDNSVIFQKTLTNTQIFDWHDNVMSVYMPPSLLPLRLSNPLSVKVNTTRESKVTEGSETVTVIRHGYHYKYKDLYKAR